MKKIGVFLHKFHRFQLFNLCLLAYFIFRLTTFFFKMSGISYIAHISYLVTKMLQVAINNIKSDVRTRMPQMTFAAHCWSAYIHSYMSRYNWFKNFFFPCE